MDELTAIDHTKTEQSIDMTEGRMAIDDVGMQNILKFFLERNPFQKVVALRKFSTGLETDSTVNVDAAEATGNSILKQMLGKRVKDFNFVWKDQAITVDVRTSAKADGESINIDPQLLFQRLATASKERPEDFDIQSVFQFEQSSPTPHTVIV